jgi:hypothetical protein
MAIDAFVHLDRLRCLSEHDGSGHSEPYLWAMLLWVDDSTLTTSELIGSTAPGNAAARLVVGSGMSAGDSAAVPSRQASFAHRFEDGLERRDLALVVAMFEHDETPDRAVRAGYDAFVREVPKAVVDFALTHGLRAPETEAEREEVAAAVRPRVEAAVRDALSGFEKFQIAIGSLGLDDELGFNAVARSVDDGDESFTLSFRKALRTPFGEFVQHYELDGRVELRQPPLPDRCQAQIDALNAARAAVSSLLAGIRALQAELHQASPAEKSFIIAEIRRIRAEELPAAHAAVEAAERDLAACRARPVLPGGGGVVVEPGGVVVTG